MKKTLALILSILMLAAMAVPAMAADATCDVCGKNTLIFYMTVAPTCTEEGYTLWKCSNSECGVEEKTDIVPALGHKYPNDYIHVDGGCTKDSYDHKYCDRCGKEDKINVTPTPGHQWGEEVHFDPNCTQPERTVKTCTVCNETKTRTVIGGKPYTGHSMKLVSAPQTCLDEAVEYYECTKCDFTSSKPTTVVDHVDENADGKCDVCGTEIVLDEEPHGFYAQLIKWISEIVEAFKAFLAAIKGDSIF